jgi:type II secretory pathway pseudopilin PulG
LADITDFAIVRNGIGISASFCSTIEAMSFDSSLISYENPPLAVKQSAFTLLEVLLACVLASMLGLLVATLMRSGLAESQQANQIRLPIATSWLLREQMEHDFANARAYSQSPNSVTLGGFLSRDPQSGMLTQHLAVVSYRIVDKANRRVLERLEGVPGPRGIEPTYSEVVWEGIQSMRVVDNARFVTGSIPVLPELSQFGMKPLTEGLSIQLTDLRGRVFLETPGDWNDISGIIPDR